MAKGIVKLFCVSILKFLPQEIQHKHEDQQLSSGDCISTRLATFNSHLRYFQFLVTFKQWYRVNSWYKLWRIGASHWKTFIPKYNVVLNKICNSKQSTSYNFNCIEILKTPKLVKTKFGHSLFHLNLGRQIYSIAKGLTLECRLNFLLRK